MRAEVKSLHGDCDWLLANFEARNDARDEELEPRGAGLQRRLAFLRSLERAKAVLKGADLSFLQVGSQVGLEIPSTVDLMKEFSDSCEVRRFRR